MVKLLRLKGDTTKGEQSKTEIKNTFRQPILVKAYSKIALAGLDVAFQDAVNQQFVVTQLGSGVTLSLNGRQIPIATATYSQQSLLAELGKQARLLAGQQGSEIDVEIDPVDTRKSRIRHAKFQTANAEFLTDWEIFGTPTLTATDYTGDATGDDSVLSSFSVPNAGCNFSAEIGSTDEIEFGVVDEGADFAFGLAINGAGNYVTKFNGDDSDTGIAAVVSDIAYIRRVGATVTVGVDILGGGDRIPPAVNTLTSAIWELYMAEGPFWYVATPTGSAGNIDNVGLTVVKTANEIPCDLRLQFTNQVMGLYFGYPTLGPFEKTADQPAVLISPQHMQGERTFRGLMVNIDPFQLESYDGAADATTRPNCLYVIHDLQSLNNEVNLDVPNLIKLDLRNESDITLNQIRITFRTSLDNTALQFSNNPIVTLLIFDKNE